MHNLVAAQKNELREDQSDLVNWTRGDRKARVEQTAERHAGLNQFAAPFLSRMKFVDEQGEGTSPTATCHRPRRRGRSVESDELAAERGRLDAVDRRVAVHGRDAAERGERAALGRRRRVD